MELPPNVTQLSGSSSQEFVDYQSSSDKRYPCFECKYQGDMPTKVFQSPEDPKLKELRLPCRIAHYLCYYCAHNRPKYANWTLITSKVTMRAPTTEEIKFVEPDKSVELEAVTKQFFDTHFDVDPVTGKQLKTHYQQQAKVNEAYAKNPRSQQNENDMRDKYDASEEIFITNKKRKQ